MAYPSRKVAAIAAVPMAKATPQTATVQTDAIEVWEFAQGTFAAVLDSAAGTGTTPTLDVKVQSSPDLGTTWVDVPAATFTQVTTGASLQLKQLSNCGTHIRFVLTLGGATPSFGVVLYVVGRAER